MSFSNYKINNFSKNQGISYQDLNDLALNDTILYNKIQAMPRGIVGFNTTSYINTFSVIQPTDNDSVEGFRIIKNSANTEFSCSFTAEDLRLFKFSLFIGSIRNSTANSYVTKGLFRAAFFVEQFDGEKYMLQSTYKTNSIVAKEPGVYQGSISMHYIGRVPAGTHVLKAGIKSYNGQIVIGEKTSSSGFLVSDPIQLYVEDLGSFIGPGVELENEF